MPFKKSNLSARPSRVNSPTTVIYMDDRQYEKKVRRCDRNVNQNFYDQI